MFVADLTIINPRAKGRRTPNPNVLIELGYAVPTLGWDRILLIQNTTNGGPDQLPFDLRGRRVVAYQLEVSASNRAETRGLLQGRLEAGLRSGLKDSMFVGSYSGLHVGVWWGNWNIESTGASRGGHLFVREVGPAGFLFDISVISGAHTGSLSGFARLVMPDLAYARLQGRGEDEVCEVSFRRRFGDGRRLIDIEEKGGCFRYHGMGATFSGTFVREHDGLFDTGALDEMDLQRLYSITGQHFSDLSRCFQMVGQNENRDSFSATVAIGAPRGLFTIMEGIVMRGSRGELWAAFIDGTEVRYFTTEYAHRNILPVTIEHWRKRFKEKPVIFSTDIDRIPRRNSEVMRIPAE
jgi:hypothetical protein